MSIAFISHSDCLLHDMGPGHPECPQRLTAITDRLVKSSVNEFLKYYEAPLVSQEALYQTHDPSYVDEIFRLAPEGNNLIQLDPDTTMNAYTLKAAMRAGGAVVNAVNLVMEGKHSAAFCSVRPPGHHAEYGRAMGFCFFNNVAVGVRHALVQWQLERVVIVDFDVHHGNGTEDIFKDESRVLLCSTFQSPFYPFQGQETLSEHIVNVPLPAGVDGEDYRRAFMERIAPALEAFRPQLVFVSAGFDGHKDDPLAGLNLTEDDYAWITGKVKAIADKYAEGRIVSTLEGGYALDALGRSVEAHIQALINEGSH
jgi:acetoin utilization deacetylase AcuC-like enzyme